MPNSDTDVLEKLASLPTIACPTASPDGDEVAFYYNITGRNELHVLDVETGEFEQWSDGEVARSTQWPVEWNSDGDHVFFHLDEAGNEQNDIYAINRDGNIKPIIEMDGQTTLEDVGEDGETLLLGSNRDGQMNLYRHDLTENETIKITNYERAASQSHLSPDGSQIAYATNESDNFDNRDAYVADVDGSNPRNLAIGEVGAEAAPADWGPGGNRLLISDNTEDFSRCGIYDKQTDEITWYGDLSYEESPDFFMPDGERFLATRTRDAAAMPVVYDTETGESHELALPEGVVGFGFGGESVLDEQRVLLTHTTPTHRKDLLAYDLDTDEYETLIEAEYGDFSPEDFADAEYFTFESNGIPQTPARAVEHDPYDTLEIGAMLYDSGQHPSPLIVTPHGGPRWWDSKSFSLYTQFLIQRGFSVLQVNYRGSKGRGREFSEELYDDWGGAEQGDIAIGVEYVLKTHDWIDENRVTVFGSSYGGYSAYWHMVQYPDLYDAGIARIGLTDLRDMYENTMPHFRTELMEKNLGTPEENSNLYDERSPVTHAENLSAPLLMLHGITDSRVPVSQARIFRDALKKAGYEEGKQGDFEYRELGEQGHGSSDIDQTIRAWRIVDKFLDRRMTVETAAVND